MRKRNFLVRIVLIASLLALLAIGCAGAQVKPIGEWSPQQRAAYFLTIYDATDAEYRAAVKLPNLTDPQKEVLRLKKKALEDLRTPVYSWLIAIDGGLGNTLLELQPMILALIDKLSLLANQSLTLRIGLSDDAQVAAYAEFAKLFVSGAFQAVILGSMSEDQVKTYYANQRALFLENYASPLPEV